MNNKKVLYVASSYGHLKNFHVPYITQLIEDGFQVEVAAGGNPKDFAKVFPNVKIHIVEFEKKIYSMKNFPCALDLHKILKVGQYDIISVHTSLAAFFLRLAVMMTYPGELKKKKSRPKVINTVHGYLFDERSSSPKKLIFIAAEKFTRCVTDTVVVMNRQDAELAEKYSLYKEKLEMIAGYGIDIDRFSYENEAKGNKFVLIYAAEFSKRKNQKFLIHGMKQLPADVYLWLAGKGEQMENCKSIVKDLGLAERVTFLGHVQNLEEYYRKAQICVSSSRSEGLPFNIMEAMACGLPVVATRVKGHEDLIEDGKNGYLFDFDDVEGFTRAVTYLKNMRESRETDWEHLCLSNAEKAQKYSLKEVKDQVMTVYKDEN